MTSLITWFTCVSSVLMSVTSAPIPQLPVDSRPGQEAFLQRYGYMAKDTQVGDPSAAADGDPDVEFQSAVESFQQFYGLPVTGVVDNVTSKAMAMPRCGVPDVVTEIGAFGRRRKRYALEGSKLKNNALTYSIINTSANQTPSAVAEDIATAAQMWSDASVFTFSQSTADSANIKFAFYSGDHVDGYPFDGPGGSLAHSFFPAPGRTNVDVHFDNDEQWTRNVPNGVNLLGVATHEMGHALGLAHSPDLTAMMFPMYMYITTPHLQQDDIDGIQALYGSGNCSVNNGNCSQYCNPHGGVCFCSPGYALDNDLTTCVAHIPLMKPPDDDGPTPEERREARICDQLQCEQHCDYLRKVCSCFDGYKLNGDGKHCVITGPCAHSNGGCAHICSGNGVCSCYYGYKLINGAGCSDVCAGNGGCPQLCNPGDGACRDFCYGNGGCGQICNPSNGACSCKDDYYLGDDGRSCISRCFPASSTLYKKSGDVISMNEVRIGDRILAADNAGNLHYDDVIAFLHRDPLLRAEFFVIHTEGAHQVTLSAEHLIYVSASKCSPDFSTTRALFARDVHVGDYVYVRTSNARDLNGYQSVAKKVLNVTTVETTGMFAPLTMSGNLVVDDVIVSCYAMIASHAVAHAAFAPLRLAYYITPGQQTGDESLQITLDDVTGIHWYASALQQVASYVLPDNLWF